MDEFSIETKLGEVVFLSENRFDQKYWIQGLADKNIKPYIYKCPNCIEGNLVISYANSIYYEKIKNLLDSKEKERIGGLGIAFKISTCDNCRKKFYIGFGYVEPHNGFEVITLHNIVKIGD